MFLKQYFYSGAVLKRLIFVNYSSIFKIEFFRLALNISMKKKKLIKTKRGLIRTFY